MKKRLVYPFSLSIVGRPVRWGVTVPFIRLRDRMAGME